MSAATTGTVAFEQVVSPSLDADLSGLRSRVEALAAAAHPLYPAV